MVPDHSLPNLRVAYEFNATTARRGKRQTCVSDLETALISMANLSWVREWAFE